MNILLRWLLFTLTVLFVAAVIPGIAVSNIWTALLVVVVLGVINLVVKPILTFVTLPINFLTLGLFSLVLNALLLMLAGYITPGFAVDGFWSAFWGALIISLISIPIEKIGERSVEA